MSQRVAPSASASDRIAELERENAQLKQATIYVFHEDEYPDFAREWTHELQSPATPEQLNWLVNEVKKLKFELAGVTHLWAGASVDRKKAWARIAELERQNRDLQAANNAYLERARKAEASDLRTEKGGD